MGKKIKRMLSLILTAVLVTTNIPVNTAYAGDETGDTEAVTEKEALTDGEISWPEAAADWYEDYEHSFVRNETAGRNELILTKYSPREAHAEDAYIVVPGTTAWSADFAGENGLIAGEELVTVLRSAGEGDGIWSHGEALLGIKILSGVRCEASATSVFAFLKNVETLDLSGLDTSETTSMMKLFYLSTKLKSLDLSSLDTSKVTDMSWMFEQASALADITFGSGFDTSHVTKMNNMFLDCFALTALDLSSFNTSQVTNMKKMFSGCGKLSQLTFGSGFNTSSVTDLSSLFAGCSALTSLDVSSFDTSKAETMALMFANCSGLTSLTLGDQFSTQSVTGYTGFYNMFAGCSALPSLDVSTFTINPGAGLSYMFLNCASLTELDLRNWNMANVRQLREAFSGCTKLESILFPESFENTGLDTIQECFKGCSSLRRLDLRGFDLSKVNTDSLYGFLKGSGILHLYLSANAMKAFDLTSSGNLGACPLATVYYAGTAAEWEALGNTLGVNPSTEKQVELVCEYTGEVQPLPGPGPDPEDPDPVETAWYEDYAHEFVSIPDQELYELHIYAYTPRDKNTIPETILIPAKTIKDGIRYVTVVDFDYTKLEYAKEDDYEASKEGFWHPGKRVIKNIGFEKGCIIGSNCERMFSNMIELQKVDFSNATAPAVEDMRAMFNNCVSMTEINFGQNFNCANCNNTQCMFYLCKSLKSLDVSMLDTSSVENMWTMFGSCKALTDLNIGGKFSTVSAKDMSLMFNDCESMTAFDLTNIRTSSATTVGSMFSLCYALESVDISGFDLSKVQSLTSMFAECKNLKSIRFGNINTSGILTMENMFQNCLSLRSLDLRSFDFTGLNGSVNECRYDNFLNGSGVVNLYLPVAAMTGVDFTQKATYGPPAIHMATTAENLRKIFYAGTEEEWTALGITKPDGVEIEYEYSGAEQEVSGDFYVTEVRLSESYLSLNAGETAQLHASVLPADAREQGISWSVKDSKIASVDANGLVTAKAKGSTEIVATAKGAAAGKTVSASCQIYVNGNGGGGGDPEPGPSEPIPGSGEATDPQPEITAEASQSVTMIKGQKFLLADKDWKVTSSDPKGVVKVSKGNVTAKKDGTATLKRGSGENEQTITVKVFAPKLEKTEKTLKLEAGAGSQLSLAGKKAADGTIAFSDEVSLPVRFVSAAPDVATVDESGNVTAVAKGKAAVTAYVNGVAFKYTVKVSETAAAAERTLHLNLTKTKNVKIKGLKKTEWVLEEGSDEGVVDIIKGSKIKALKAGTVTLKCEGYTLTVIAEDPSIKELKDTKKPYSMSLELNLTDKKESEKIELTAVEQDVFFKSSKSSVAYMDAEGVIHARSKGKAKLSAKVNGRTVSITVTVK